MTVCLIIPAYNEEKRLGSFLKTIAEYYKQHPQDIQQIIVVDDGSTDRTSAVTTAYQNKLPLELIKLQSNQGKGAAIKAGVMKASASHVIFIDADGATPITELPKMKQALTSASMASGNRWMAGAQVERHSLIRKLAGWANHTYMKCFGLGDIDIMCGFKGFELKIARDLFSNLQEKRWLFDTEIAYKARLRGYTIKNFPISWQSKDGSKLTTFTLLKSAFSIYPLLRHIKAQEKA